LAVCSAIAVISHCSSLFVRQFCHLLTRVCIADLIRQVLSEIQISSSAIMKNGMFGGYMNRGESYAHSNHSNKSLSGVSFDSSFSSADSIDSWEMIATPSPTRRDSYDPFDMDALSFSSSRTSMASSPIHQEFATSISCNMAGIPNQSLMYSTPSNKTPLNHSLMTYDFQYGNVMYSDLNEEFASDPASMSFEDSSPISIGTPTLSPYHFVNPSQTFLEPFQPTTPLGTPRKSSRNALASSPMEDFSCQSGQPPYFMSPMQSPCRSSARSSASSVSVKRSSSTSPALASSAALHRVQETCRINKLRVKNESFGNGISRVAAGEYFCNFPGCQKSKNRGFTRQEHLKRHLLTHTQARDLGCPFCHKCFQSDRKDNWKAHIKLHALPDKKAKRTQFDPNAVVLYAKLMRESEKEKEAAAKDCLTPSPEIVRGSIRRNAARLAGATF
jgi:hypothetical protein